MLGPSIESFLALSLIFHVYVIALVTDVTLTTPFFRDVMANLDGHFFLAFATFGNVMFLFQVSSEVGRKEFHKSSLLLFLSTRPSNSYPTVAGFVVRVAWTVTLYWREMTSFVSIEDDC